eukprot:1143607-Pelagomonas_calceolata.AAC.2
MEKDSNHAALCYTPVWKNLLHCICTEHALSDSECCPVSYEGVVRIFQAGLSLRAPHEFDHGAGRAQHECKRGLLKTSISQSQCMSVLHGMEG